MEAAAAVEAAAAAAKGAAAKEAVGERLWVARRASREVRGVTLLGVNEGGGAAPARGDDAAGSGAGLAQVAPEASSAAAVGWGATLESDDETRRGGGAERAVLGESEASASPGSRLEGMVGGGASESSTRLLPRRPSLVDGRGTTRTPGGEAPHTASSARGGGAQAMPSLSKLCPQAMPSLTKLCPSWVGSGSWRRSLGGGGYPIGEAAPGSSTSESDSNCALGMFGMLSRRTSLGSMASRCDERAADIGRATVIAAGAALAGSSLGRTRLLDHRTRSMAAGTAAG